MEFDETMATLWGQISLMGEVTPDDPDMAASLYLKLGAAIEALETARHNLADGLTRAMDADGATEWHGDSYKAELVTKTEYDKTRLSGLLELVPEADLVKSGAYTPAHDEVVHKPASWNMTKVKPYAKRGREYAEVIESAKFPGRRTLKVTAPDD